MNYFLQVVSLEVAVSTWRLRTAPFQRVGVPLRLVYLWCVTLQLCGALKTCPKSLKLKKWTNARYKRMFPHVMLDPSEFQYRPGRICSLVSQMSGGGGARGVA